VFDFVDIDSCIDQYMTDDAPACVRNYARTMTIKANTADHADVDLVEQWTKNRRQNKPTPTKYFFDGDLLSDREQSYYERAQSALHSGAYNHNYPAFSGAANPEKNKYKIKHKKLPAKETKYKVYKSSEIKKLEDQEPVI
jgi:HD superfamily phosphohydrolase